MTQLKILVIDDEPDIRSLLKEHLMELGHVVHEAEDGGVGFMKFKKMEYDLVICDVNMPKMTGYEVVEAIRQCNKKIKIVMLTACGGEDLVKKIVALGISGYMLKPFDFEKVKARLEKIFGPMEATEE